MTEEDYLAWREHPATQWFLSALSRVADLNETTAKERVWACAMAGEADLIDAHDLTVLAEKAKAYRMIAGADFDDLQSFHEEADEQ